MNKITLDTESYLVIGKENERFYPFLELEFNETVIYENDIPKYYLSSSDDLTSAHGIGDWIMADLEKNGYKLNELIIELGNSLKLKWNISSSNAGKFVDDSWKPEIIELSVFNDSVIKALKTTPQQRV